MGIYVYSCISQYFYIIEFTHRISTGAQEEKRKVFREVHHPHESNTINI